VVSDSDLNNNPLFYGALKSLPAINAALDCGFIRRAVRQHDGGPATQRLVAENLRKSNPKRFEEIRPGHVDYLDWKFAKAERTHPPLIWTGAELGNIFVSRLKEMLRGQLGLTTSPETVRTVHAIRSWVDEQKRQGLPVLAAQLEAQVRPRSAGAQEVAAWEECWPLVLQAYNGNVPIAFQGKVIQADNGINSDRFIPSGPESDDDELAGEIELYDQAAAGRFDAVQIDVRYEQPDSRRAEALREIGSFQFDEQRLAELSFAEAVELREACEPEKFFAARYESLGSSEYLTHWQDQFWQEAAGYATRLHSRAEKLNQVFRAQIDTAVNTPKMRSFFISDYDESELAGQLVAIATPVAPIMGSQIVACDLNLLRQFRTDLDLGDENNSDIWRFKRPDFRIIKKMDQRDM
jgi:hypothetical protein